MRRLRNAQRAIDDCHLRGSEGVRVWVIAGGAVITHGPGSMARVFVRRPEGGERRIVRAVEKNKFCLAAMWIEIHSHSLIWLMS